MPPSNNYNAQMLDEIAKEWNGGVSDPLNPSETKIQDMYELQMRIDAGEDVVIPEEKEEKKSNGFTFTEWKLADVTYYPTSATTVYKGNLITTDPSKKNAVNKYTGKKMKYT